jgi:hypothetical protein
MKPKGVRESTGAVDQSNRCASPASCQTRRSRREENDKWSIIASISDKELMALAMAGCRLLQDGGRRDRHRIG